MKTTIKIVLVLAILTACFQASRYALNNFQFEDAVQQALLFETRISDDEVVGIVMKIADEYGIPLDASTVEVRRVGQDRIVDMTYTTTIPLLPGVYDRPWTFKPQASTRLLTGGAR